MATTYNYKPAQIYSIVNSAVAQAIGDASLTATDTSTLVSVGDAVLSTNTNKEMFFNALADRIGKVVADIDVYVSRKRSIYKNVIDFGNALQMLVYEFGQSSIDRGWAGVNATETTSGVTTRSAQMSPYTNAPNESVKQYIFKDFCAWEYDSVIPDFQLRGSFTNADAMATFISGLTIAKQNKLALDVETLGNLAIGRAMVECYKKANAVGTANTNLVVNVLGYYNTKVLGLSCTSSSGTISYPAGWVKVANAWSDEGFVKFFSEFIKNRVSQFADFGGYFNIDGHKTFCNSPVVEINSQIAQRCEYATANVYHNNVVALPNYKAINYWQSPSDGTTTYDISATTKISVSDGTNGYAMSDVAGFIYDERAVMVTVEDYRSHTLYNPKDEVLNTYDKSNIKYAVVPFRNMTVLQIADPTGSGSTVNYHLTGVATVSS